MLKTLSNLEELVRYRLNSLGELVYSEKGQYVLYSQAAKVIAAKDKEIQELKEKLGVVSTERHADAEYIGHLQAELAELKNNMIELQSERVVETMAYEKLTAELAQIKEKEPS